MNFEKQQQKLDSENETDVYKAEDIVIMSTLAAAV